MRATKPQLLTALTAVLVTLVLALTVTLTGTATGAGAATAERKPRHNLKVDAKELDSANRFVLFGKVPTYPRGQILLTRSVGGGSFDPVRKLKTSHNGRFRARIFQVPGRLTCFKVVVPKTADYRRTTSKGASCIKS